MRKITNERCPLSPRAMYAPCDVRGEVPFAKVIGSRQDRGEVVLIEEGVREIEPTVDVTTTHRDEDYWDAGSYTDSVLNVKIGLETSLAWVLSVGAAIEGL